MNKILCRLLPGPSLKVAVIQQNSFKDIRADYEFYTEGLTTSVGFIKRCTLHQAEDIRLDYGNKFKYTYYDSGAILVMKSFDKQLTSFMIMKHKKNLKG